MTSGRPLSGLLPTSGRFDGEVGEFVQRYIIWPGGLGPLVSVAPGAWYGAGVTLATRAERVGDGGGPRGGQLLDAEVRWDARGREVGWSVVGDLHRGGDRVHLAADIEEVSRRDYWETARLERPGVLRAGRRSRIGVSLSGAGHDLQVRVGHWSDAPWRDGEEFEARLRYASDWVVADGWEAGVDLFHRDAVRQTARDHHGSLILGEFVGLLGERRRLWGDGGLVASLGNRLISSRALDDLDSGFDARGSTQLVGFARGGLTVQADLGRSGYHRIEPSVALFREIVGAGGTQTDTAFDSTPPGRVPRWSALAAVVEQTFRFGRTRLTWPIGLLVDGGGLGELVDRPALLTSRLDARIGQLNASVGLLTDTSFGRLDYRSGVGWMLGGAELYVESSSLTAAETPALYLNRHAGDAGGSLRRLQPLAAGLSTDGGGRVHTAGVDWWIDAHRIHTEYFMSGGFESNGFRGGWTWRWPELGWGIGVSGAYETSRGVWGVTAGLDARR